MVKQQVLVFAMLILSVVCEEPNPLSTALKGLVNGDGKALENIQKVLKTESETSIVRREQSTGFSNANLVSRCTYVDGVPLSWIQQKLRPESIMQGFQFGQKEQMDAFLNEATSALMNNVRLYRDDVMTITFSGGSGSVAFLYISVKRNEDGTYRYRFASAGGNFQLAPDILIVTKTKSNFFRKKTGYEMVPVEKGLTQNDIQQLTQMLFPMLTSVMDRFASEE
eukprot:TRINITY_DN12699_c0_g1_i1.p1 TRINITY_DN12699_c0_g1~~TRINITY_DN12699_c0_g1_i1.p1  ORF type:complete len:224 (-),score=40.82 TRINITY_DN12699_c0_g1_i1:30-701(-)